MNILILCGTLWPQPSNNTNLLKKLLPHLTREHTVRLLAPAPEVESLPDTVDGVRVHWLRDDRRDPLRRLVFPAIARLVDRNGFSDALQTMVLIRHALELRAEFPYDMVVGSMEPYYAGAAAAFLPFSGQRVLYLMDPPGMVCDENNDTPFRRRFLPRVFRRMDRVLTTPFIREALEARGFTANFREVGFPMLEAHPYTPTPDDIPMHSGKIDLLFCGWLCSGLRSPVYFLQIAKHLDERFRLVFMGKECDLLRERFDFDTRAEVVTLPNQPYRVALNAMHDADILINIGNCVPIHMPSKTLEYINTGKPIVNFHKMADCPTLHYTRRYQLCLNLFEEGTPDEDTIAEFIRFCTENRGKTIPVPHIPDCTPEHIAQVLLGRIGEHHE